MRLVFEDVCRQLGLTDKAGAATRLVGDKTIELASAFAHPARLIWA
jgi:hypothetical protein